MSRYSINKFNHCFWSTYMCTCDKLTPAYLLKCPEPMTVGFKDCMYRARSGHRLSVKDHSWPSTRYYSLCSFRLSLNYTRSSLFKPLELCPHFVPPRICGGDPHALGLPPPPPSLGDSLPRQASRPGAWSSQPPRSPPAV